MNPVFHAGLTDPIDNTYHFHSSISELGYYGESSIGGQVRPECLATAIVTADRN